LINRGANEEGWLLKFPEEGAGGVRRIEPALKTTRGRRQPGGMADNRHVVLSLQATMYGSEQLWLLDTQSGERHALTSGTGNAFGPTLAPQGNRLVFRETNGNFDVVSVDLATGTANTLISTERNELMPAWAAAEQAMVYVSDRNGPHEIWFRRVGVPDRPIVSGRDFSPDTTRGFMAPVLSPRGDRVIYTTLETDAPARLWISAVAGGTPIRATNDDTGGAEFPGAWSPDDAWFVFYALRDGKLNLMKIKTGGEAAPVMIKAGVDDNAPLPDWSPTGEWIVCGDLLISPDGKTERSLGSHRSPHYAFSKNGKLAVRTASGKRHTDAVLDRRC
jgi:Tol biopolymer transport system component